MTYTEVCKKYGVKKEDVEKKCTENTSYWEKTHDLSLYTKDYLEEGIYSCKWSLAYARHLKKSVPDLSSIIDWGAGLGESTLELQRLYPDAQVEYYDLYPKRQNATPHKVECICCWEVLEHSLEPIKLLQELLSYCDILCWSASFNVKAYGHFLQPNAMRECTAELKKWGTKFDSGAWNGRPSIWRKK